MRADEKPLPLKNAPLNCAPTNELGVVYFFAHMANRLNFRVAQIGSGYPDCTAYRRTGNGEKEAKIEFEFRSSNFRAHGHDPSKCNYIVCWHDDWHQVPKHIEIISLKKYFGVSRNVWIQQAIRSEQYQLDGRARLEWAVSPRSTRGDILLMYRASPACQITDIFQIISEKPRYARAGWRDGNTHLSKIQRICNLDSPIFLRDLRNHRILRTSSFIRRNMQGRGLSATEYWSYLYEMIAERNPKSRKALSHFAPERL
jgi:hypothetical protein